MTYAYFESESGHVFQTDNPRVWEGPFLRGKRLSKAEGERRHKEQAREALLRILEKGDKVYCVLRSVNRSGDFRCIDFYAIKDNRPIWITEYMAALMGRTISKKGGLQVRGGGMDMGFHEVYSLARTLWPNGNDERDDRDGGYLLRSEWI